MNEINDLVVLSNSTWLVRALLGILAVVMVSRWLDARAGVPFRNAIDSIRADPAAAGRYYGLRFLGLCVLVGAALY